MASSGSTDSQAAAAANTRASYFPLGYREGFSQWWAGLAPAVTEHRVMSFVPHLRQPPTHMHSGTTAATTADSNESAQDDGMAVDPSAGKDAKPVRTLSPTDPYGPRQWSSRMVQLSGTNRYLNEFSVERLADEKPATSATNGAETKETAENHLVMLHGYGAGLGFFYKNFEGLSRLPHWKLYALDMLGMGRSSRPPFKIYAKGKEEKVREAEGWFVDALEEWRVQQGIEKMTLMGHSLGGYLAVCYALKYPGHLKKLILASPVGIPEDPYAVQEDLPEPNESTMQNELTSSAKAGQQPPPRKPMPRWLTTLWDANISPFSVVRMSGPLGPRLVSGWTSRRFSHLPAEEAQALHDYSYSLFRQRGSGEYALAYVLAPGAFARSPLIRRIQGVGRQYLDTAKTSTASLNPAPTAEPAAAAPAADSARPREHGFPIVFMYGSHDWMDANGGHDSVKKLQEVQREILAKADEEEKRKENGAFKVVTINNAGHHVYLDGWEQFNEVVREEMRDVEKRDRRLQGGK